MKGNTSPLTLLKTTLGDFISSPQLFTIVLSSVLCFMILSSNSPAAARLFDTNTELTIYTILFSLSVLFLTAVFGSAFIGTITNRRNNTKTSLGQYMRHDAFKVFGALLITLALYNIVFFTSYFLAFALSKAIDASVSLAEGIFFIIYLLGILGVLLFSTYTSFFVVTHKKTVIQSVGASIHFVKVNYPSTLCILLASFIAYEGLNLFLTGMVQTLIGAFIITPVTVALLLNNLLLSHDI